MSAAASVMECYLKFFLSVWVMIKWMICLYFSVLWVVYVEEEVKGGWKMLNESYIVKVFGGVLMKLSGGKVKL